MMTDREIAAEFERIERIANRTPKGADHEAILRTVAAMADRDLADVRRVILDGIFSQPN